MAERYDFYVHDNRKITFNLTEPIMREDSGVTDFVFHIPKILNELEVSDWAWWLVFVNAKKEKYSIALTLSDDPERPLEYNLATYTVDYAMSIKAGSVQFALEAINAGTGGAIDNEWHTQSYEIKVKETLQGNQAEYAETESDIISALIQEVRTKMNQVIGGATPTPVASVSAMTDTSKLYLLTTDGEWYYYNGSAWASGGVYGTGVVDPTPTQGSTNAVSSGGVYSALQDKADKNSTPETVTPEETGADFYLSDEQGNVLLELAGGHIKTKNFDSSEIDFDVETDTTLTEEGKPADAKATGDRITAVEEELSGIDTESPVKDASSADADLYICDSSGNVVGEFINGHIRTKNFDSADIEGLPEDVSVLQEDVSELQSALESATTGVLYRNKEVTDGVYAICRWHQPNTSSKQFCLLVSGDIHGDEVRMQSIVEYFNTVNAFDAGIMLGDIVGNDWRNSATFYTNAIKNVNKPWLTVIGNHDSGSGGESATKETAYTNIADLVAKFYTPNLQYADLKSGEYVAGNSYYYKDFASQKIRLIVLNQYEYPPDYDDTNNTFVYLRGYECYSQAQITWLCNVLLNTPTDYGVIIALHSYPAWMLIDSSNLFTSSTIDSTNTPRLISYSTNGFILEEIVNAFISGTSINAEFAYTVSGSFGSGVTVDADFSSRGTGEFITYIGGHWHMPVVSSTHKYGQKMFTVPCASLGSAQQGDTPRFAGTRSEDNFCALAVDRDLRTVKLLQIGAHFTKDGVDRVIGNYVYGGTS